jgi:crotonobetaine/carnitine-CoA ligase
LTEPRTIPRFFRAAVDAAPDKTWLITPEVDYTYALALARVERAAAALRALGVQPDDRVVVVARNTADFLLTWLALMDVGAIQVPINPKSSDTERDGFVQQVRPKLVIDETNVAALFDAPADGRGPADRDERDVAVMIPTSGTTGRSKLVMQTHLAYVMAGEGFPYWLRLNADDRLLTSLPLFHINAPAYSVLGSVAARASVVVLPGFSAHTFLDDARRFGATEFNSIGAMLEILVRQPPRPDDADNPIRICYTGPSPDREHQLAIEERFGFEIVCGYALSETPYALIWKHGDRPYGSLGSPRQHPTLGHINDARVRDDGELELRNPAIMRGYFEMPEATSAAIVDGWLRTGDLVRDNGDDTYTFLGRKKDVIRRRGENLSPLEVEAALERHPAVVEAAVIAVPSDLSEDDVKAFVTATTGHVIDAKELHEFVRGELARYKVPRYIEVVDALPHTATDRLAKHQLPRERTTNEVDFEHEG